MQSSLKNAGAFKEDYDIPSVNICKMNIVIDMMSLFVLVVNTVPTDLCNIRVVKMTMNSENVLLMFIDLG